MGKTFTLKQGGVKTYARITDVNPYLEQEWEKMAFAQKDSDIIREIVDRTDVVEATLDLYTYDSVYRLGIDRYDKEDYVYGSRLMFTQQIHKNFILVGEYRWESTPREPAYRAATYPRLTIEIRPINVPTMLFGGVNNKAILRKQFNVEQGKPIDLQPFTNNKALSKYKQYLMKCKFTGNKTTGTVQL